MPERTDAADGLTFGGTGIARVSRRSCHYSSTVRRQYSTDNPGNHSSWSLRSREGVT